MNEKAFLTVSFGTSHADTRKKTIEAIEKDLASAFFDRQMYHAWTSGRIISKVKKTEGLSMDNLEEALKKMANEGKKDIVIQPTYMMNGIESERALTAIRAHAGLFERLQVGVPLLSSENDLECLAEALIDIFPQVGEKDLLLLMGHGTPQGDNSCYWRMNEMFRKKACPNRLIGLVEGEPGITDLLETIREQRPEQIYLAPFMIVAGDHALNDMAGDSKDSWKAILKSEGYAVSCVLQGMGEYPQVRALFERHAREASLLETGACCE